MSNAKSWAQLRAIGIAIRARFASSEQAGKDLIGQHSRNASEKKMMDEAVAFVANNLATARSENKSALIAVVEALAKDLGPAGRLALCDLTRMNIRKVADVIMLFIHSIILNTTVYDVKVRCTGCLEDDDAWNNEEGWPEVAPNGWNISGNYSFRYEISQDDKRMTVIVKGIVMGEILLLTALPVGDDKPLTVNVRIGDFSATTEDRVAAALDEPLNLRSTGLSAIVPRAAATQLNEVIQTQVMTPLLDRMGVVRRAPAANVEVPRRSRDPNADPLRAEPVRPNLGPAPWNPLSGQVPPGPGLGIPGGLGGYGDDDLLPGGGRGRGGGLFAPGNEDFDRYFGRGGQQPLPPGHPPGARFDPFAPNTQPRPRPGPNGGRGSGGRGNVPGTPRPDHLRPPDFEDDFMYS